MKPSCQCISNELEIVFIPSKNLYSATICLRGKAGSNYELPQEIGSAHLLEHLILNKNNNVTNSGGKVLGITSRDEVTFIVKVLQKDLATGLKFLANNLINTSFDKNFIAEQKELIKQEIVRSTNTPEKFLTRVANGTIFPNGRMSVLNTGEIKHIEKLQPEDLKGFKNRLYTTENFKLFIYGDFDKKKVFKLCEKYFSKALISKPSNKKDENELIQKNLEKVEKKVIRIINQPQFKQTYLRIDFYGRKLIDKEKEANACLMKILEHQLNKDLGGLVQKVVCTSFSSLNYGISGIYIVAQEKDMAAVVGKVGDSIKQTEIAIKKDMVEAIKKILISNILFGVEKPTVLMEFYSQNWLFGKRILVEQEIKNIKSVTANQIMLEYRYIFGQEPKITVLSENIDKKILEAF